MIHAKTPRPLRGPSQALPFTRGPYELLPLLLEQPAGRLRADLCLLEPGAERLGLGPLLGDGLPHAAGQLGLVRPL